MTGERRCVRAFGGASSLLWNTHEEGRRFQKKEAREPRDRARHNSLSLLL
jgi:hypothetical protein